MKRIIVAFALVTFTFHANADVKTIPVGQDWSILKFSDDFDDTKACAIKPTKARGLIIFANHSKSGKHTLLKISNNIDGVGIKYRVDKNEPVLIGFEYEFQTKEDYYFPNESETLRMVSDFKAGKQVVYSITSSNQFVDDIKGRVSLEGFSKAYELAEKCE